MPVRLADEDRAQVDFARLTSAYDIVIAHRFDHTPPWPDTVVSRSLLAEPLDVALPADSPLAAARQVRAADVARLPWITTHEGWPVGAIVEALAAVTGHPVHVQHRVNDFGVVAELVRAGAGVALMPRWTVPPPAGVVLAPLRGVRTRRRIDALCRPENVARPAVRSVVDELHRIAGAIRRRQS